VFLGECHEESCRAFREGRVWATAIEYGLIAALISIGIVAGARALGQQISATFNTATGTMKSA
jgi:pilus assembly protein Flp/PilA